MKAINIRLELHPTGEHVEEAVELSAELVAKALLDLAATIAFNGLRVPSQTPASVGAVRLVLTEPKE